MYSIEIELQLYTMMFVEYPKIGKTDKTYLDMFENVTAIVYVLSLTSFDEVIENDKDNTICNAMEKSLQTLKEYAMHPSLSKIPFILIFSKDDLLEQKLNNLVCFTKNMSFLFRIRSELGNPLGS